MWGPNHTRAAMALRVANVAQSTDITSPNASVAVITLVAPAIAPKTGTERGMRIMSPRPVTDETRPVYSASIAWRNAPDSQTDAMPAVTPTVSIPSSTTGRNGAPAIASPTPCSTRILNPARAVCDGWQRIASRLPAIAPAASDPSPNPSHCAPQSDSSTRSASPSATTGVTNTFSAVSPVMKMRAVGLRHRYATPSKKDSHQRVCAERGTAYRARTTRASTSAMNANDAPSITIAATGPYKATMTPPAGAPRRRMVRPRTCCQPITVPKSS